MAGTKGSVLRDGRAPALLAGVHAGHAHALTSGAIDVSACRARVCALYCWGVAGLAEVVPAAVSPPTMIMLPPIGMPDNIRLLSLSFAVT
ncbi:MAG: hypothetical protein QOG00_1813 [Pyrinomonadaceae bacterium]|nr:hypothetical protein [Pyrinomonadaceae bacterium]